MFPFELAEGPNIDNFWPLNNAINISIEIFFVLDIILNFFTTYRDKTDVQVYDKAKIAYN